MRANVEPASRLAEYSAPLVAGSLAVADEEGNGISGMYTGTVDVTNDAQRASLLIEIASGTGEFAGVRGALTANGIGHFLDDGDFVLNSLGTLTAHDGHSAIVALNIRGTSQAHCGTSARIVISASGAGTLSRAGRVTATLHHEVALSGCAA
jgi:hypothetical protein